MLKSLSDKVDGLLIHSVGDFQCLDVRGKGIPVFDQRDGGVREAYGIFAAGGASYVVGSLLNTGFRLMQTTQATEETFIFSLPAHNGPVGLCADTLSAILSKYFTRWVRIL